MFLYAKLYLAHMLGDFVFQFEELYALKTKNKLGHFFHVFIHVAFMAALAWPYLNSPTMWIAIVAIALIHLGQDLLKYSWTKRAPKLRFVLFILDQVFHALVILLIFIFPFSSQTPSLNAPAWLSMIYLDPEITWMLILFLWATFGLGYTLHSLRITYFKNSRPDHYITSPEMTHGLIERSLLTFILAFSNRPEILFMAPFVLLLRVPFEVLRNKTDIVLNVAGCVILAACWRMLT